jgi:hypothetical protein
MQVAEIAGALGVAGLWHHTQNPPVLSTLGVRLPPPGATVFLFVLMDLGVPRLFIAGLIFPC